MILHDHHQHRLCCHRVLLLLHQLNQVGAQLVTQESVTAPTLFGIIANSTTDQYHISCRTSLALYADAVRHSLRTRTFFCLNR